MWEGWLLTRTVRAGILGLIAVAVASVAAVVIVNRLSGPRVADEGQDTAATSAEPREDVDAKTVDALIHTLGLPGKESKADRGRAVAALAAMGDDVVAALMARMEERRAFAVHADIIKTLAAIGTPAARNQLLAIALGEVDQKLEPTSRAVAARRLMEQQPDPQQARALLAADVPGVVEEGLKVLRGTPLDADLVGRMERLLHCDRRRTRSAAAWWLGADASPQAAGSKVEAILRSVADAPTMKNATAPYLTSPGCTNEQEYYRACIGALAHMAEADSALQAARAPAGSMQHVVVTLARMRRGDSSVRQQAYDLVGREAGDPVRRWALEALGVGGTQADIPFLREVATNDPEMVMISSFDGGSRPYYPIRAVAETAIRWIRKRTGREGP